MLTEYAKAIKFIRLSHLSYLIAATVCLMVSGCDFSVYLKCNLNSSMLSIVVSSGNVSALTS